MNKRIGLILIAGLMMFSLVAGCSSRAASTRANKSQVASSSKKKTSPVGKDSALVKQAQKSVNEWMTNTGTTYKSGKVTLKQPQTMVFTLRLNQELGNVDLDGVKTALISGLKPTIDKTTKQRPKMTYRLILENPDKSILIKAKINKSELKAVQQ